METTRYAIVGGAGNWQVVAITEYAGRAIVGRYRTRREAEDDIKRRMECAAQERAHQDAGVAAMLRGEEVR